jgi:hypothetical protein
MQVSTPRAMIVVLVATLVAALLVACGSALPTPDEEQRKDDYGRALERCKESAKARDADVDDYRRCAHQVDVDYGRVDGGTHG